MVTKFQKAQEVIRGFDLFAQPVQLTHQGKTAFKTGMGGCVSLLLTLAIVAGAIMQLEQVYYRPEFNAFPPSYDFSSTNVTMDFGASTLAIGVMVVPKSANFS